MKTEYAYDCDILHADRIKSNRFCSLIPAYVNRQSKGEDRELEMYETLVEAHGEAIKSHMRIEGEIPARVEVKLTRRLVEGEEPEELADLTFENLCEQLKETAPHDEQNHV